MIPSTTRMVVLRDRPGRGQEPSPDLFAIEEFPIPDLQPGQLLVRNIAMTFDGYLRAGNAARYSRTV